MTTTLTAVMKPLLMLAALASAVIAAATVAYVARREPEYTMAPWPEGDDGWGVFV